jgi:hypothetical protein
MDDSVKNSELKRQIESLESDRNRLMDQLSERMITYERSRLINSEVSNISRQIDQLFKEKEKNTLTSINIKNILQRNFEVLDKKKKMIITVKPDFTRKFIIYYLSKDYDFTGRYILDISKKEVNTLTQHDKTTWYNENDNVVQVFDNKLPAFEGFEDYEGEDFFDQARFRINNYHFLYSAQFKFYIKYIMQDVQIQSICILNRANTIKRLVFDIGKVASKIQNGYRINIKEKNRRKQILKNLTDELPHAPPGQYHKSFPGGIEYLEANERWKGYNSFGKRKVRLSMKQLKRDLKKVI